MNLEDLLPLIAMAIPILAITGGIIAGIVRAVGQQRLIELAHRERIAAIERGIDPSKLPPLPVPDDCCGPGGAGTGSARRRGQGLMIAGLVTLALGISLSVVFRQVEPHEAHWVIGVIPAAVGLALLVSAWIVWPRRTNGKP